MCPPRGDPTGPDGTRRDRQIYDASTFQEFFIAQPDVPLTAWIVAWGAHTLGEGSWSELFHANVFHPEPNALAYSEHMLGALPIFAPLYWITGKLALSYNLFVISTFILSAVAAYWAALRWLGSYTAAALVGGIYAFTPHRFYALTHAQMLSIQYLPVVAYLIWAGGGLAPIRRWLTITEIGRAHV